MIELSVFITINPVSLKCFKVPFSYRSDNRNISDIVWKLIRLLAKAGIAAATLREGFLYFKGDRHKTLYTFYITSEEIGDIECKIKNEKYFLILY